LVLERNCLQKVYLLAYQRTRISRCFEATQELKVSSLDEVLIFLEAAYYRKIKEGDQSRRLEGGKSKEEVILRDLFSSKIAQDL